MILLNLFLVKKEWSFEDLNSTTTSELHNLLEMLPPQVIALNHANISGLCLLR